MATQTPLPYAFSRRDEFLRLPLESRTAYLWEAYEFCLAHLGGARFPEDELQRNLRVLRRMMLHVAKEVARKLSADGSWANSDDVRWPRNHKGDDVDHWYNSGAFPPQFITLPEDPAAWRAVLADQPECLFDEMIAWVETPAGHAAVGDEELQKLLADREVYLPESARKKSVDPPVADWVDNSADRSLALQWLAAKSEDGRLAGWAQRLGLTDIERFLGGLSSNRRPMEQLVPELMKLEQGGALEKLQQYLDVEEPADSAKLVKLRCCLPRPRF